MPTQGQIDSFGGSKSISASEARFELAYQKCRDENVTLVGGVATTAVRFARYLRRKHKVYPKDLWNTQIVTLGSVPGINTRYRPALHALYGKVAIREIYGATECMFGQQRDEKKASRTRPNYDLFFFEVETRSGIKMLHEMQAAKDAAWRDREYGRLDAGAVALQDWRPDTRVRTALLPLHWPREVVDAAAHAAALSPERRRRETLPGFQRRPQGLAHLSAQGPTH